MSDDSLMSIGVIVVVSLVWGSAFMMFSSIGYTFYSKWSACMFSGRSITSGASAPESDVTTSTDVSVSASTTDDACNRGRVTACNIHLIIDGCNGPIRFRETLLRNQTTSPEAALSLLRTSSSQQVNKNSGGIVKRGGEGERLNMIPLLHRLIHDTRRKNNDVLLHSVNIVFDGVSQSKRSNSSATTEPKQPMSTKERTYQVTAEINVDITDIYEEADNVMVDRATAMASSLSQHHTMPHDGGAPDTLDQVADSFDGSRHAFVIHRRMCGPGKSRRALQSLGLLREDSVACLFGWTPALREDARRTEQSLRKLPAELFHPIKSIQLCGRGCDLTTKNRPPLVPVLVTDDVFLRQRVINDASGFVMSFDQLWLLLKEQQDLLGAAHTAAHRHEWKQWRFW